MRARPIPSPVRILVATGAAALLVVGLAEAATAADPVGTVTLTGGTSPYARVYEPIGVAADQLVYRDNDTLLAQPLGGGTAVEITGDYPNEIDTAGDLVTWQTSGDSAQRWRNLRTGDSGDGLTDWLAAAPEGGVFLSQADDGDPVHLMYERVVDPTHPVDLGTLGLPDVYDIEAVVGPDGVEVDQGGQDGGAGLAEYVAFDQPGTVTTLSLAGLSSAEKHNFTCTSATATEVGCYTATHVVRLSLSGAAPRTVSATEVSAVQLTDTTTGWLDEVGDGGGERIGAIPVATFAWHTAPADGGTVQDFASPVNGGAVAGPDTFYLGYAAEDGTGGLYSVGSAADTPATVVAADKQPNVAMGAGIGPGRVAWRDDADTTRPVWSRSLSTSRTKVVAGGRSLTATSSSGYSLTVSGTRTAVDRYAGPNAAGSLLVTNGTKATTIARAFGPTLSGNRLLYTETVHDHRILRDLRTGENTDLTTSLGRPTEVTLWGNYLVYAKRDASVWRVSLTPRSKAVRLSAPAPKGYTSDFADLSAWGDWVAWSVYSEKGSTSRTTSGVRNAATLAKARTLGSRSPIGASASGVELRTTPGNYFLQPWSGGTITRLPTVGGYGPYLRPQIDGTTMAWINPSNVLKVAPVKQPGRNRPRSLGDGSAARSVKVGHAWTFQLPTSAALTRCSVIVKLGKKTVGTLPCTKASRAQGVVVTTWTPAKRAKHGTYSWTVSAGNADGSLLTSAGKTSATTGTIAVG